MMEFAIADDNEDLVKVGEFHRIRDHWNDLNDGMDQTNIWNNNLHRNNIELEKNAAVLPKSMH